MADLTAAEWDVLRDRIRSIVEQHNAVRLPGLRISAIDYAALQQARTWTVLGGRRVDWDWYRIVKRRPKSRVEAAFWWNDQLCGLVFGRSSDDAVIINRLEGHPSNGHPLRGEITDLGIAVLETQALALGINITLLEDPDPSLIPRYMVRGYDWMTEPSLSGYLGKVRP
jgi:hypothetical protein